MSSSLRRSCEAMSASSYCIARSLVPTNYNGLDLLPTFMFSVRVNLHVF